MKCDTSQPAFHFKVKDVLLKSAEPGSLNREILVRVMMPWSRAKQSISTVNKQLPKLHEVQRRDEQINAPRILLLLPQ